MKKVKDWRFSWVMIISLVCVLSGFHAHAAPSKYTLSKDSLLGFGQTYVTPHPWSAWLLNAESVPGRGVRYNTYIAGWDIGIGLGGTSPVTDLTPYSSYVLTFENTSQTDSYNVNLYLKSGASSNYHESGWSMLFPGQVRELSLDLTSISELDDVKEVGFGLGTWVGTEHGYADEIQVTVVVPDDPVPEASTLTLFSSGLAGLGFFARGKIRRLFGRG